MRKIRKWENEEGMLEFEATVLVEFISSGHDDPGITSGPVDKCYPPDYEDIRTVTEAKLILYHDNKEIGTINLSELSEIQDICSKAIEDAIIY